MTTTGLSCLFRTGLGQFLLLSAQSAPAQNIARYGTCIRSGPSRQARVMLVVPGGYPIEVLEQSDGWTRFRDWQNSTARVASPLVSDIDTAVILASRGQIRSDAGVIRTVLAKKKRLGPTRALRNRQPGRLDPARHRVQRLRKEGFRHFCPPLETGPSTPQEAPCPSTPF